MGYFYEIDFKKVVIFAILYLYENSSQQISGREKMKAYQRSSKNLPWWTLFLAALCALATVGYIVYQNGGIFTYYGDYNCQQICFYRHAHEMVKSGSIGWDWGTDLGANFIGSYSFYLLFSPFFWLTLPFPTEAVPYLMAPLFVLKFCTCAFTAYFYIARFVKDKRFAVIGGLLYAFSGYCIYNLFFNHFLDVVAFFPLILLTLEELMTENKRGPFALAVALNAIVNYWFFIGEVIFVILYFFIRLTDPKIENRLKNFLFVALESVLGLFLAAFAVLPSVLAIFGNPRTGVDNFLNGWSLWLYYSEQRIPAIIASFFFPPDMPSRQNMFTGQGAQWASMAGWLPLFGMTGVIAYVRSRKKTWLTKMIFACILMALVPVLNSLFVLLNYSYYDRWFYMFELILVVATVKALESCSENIEETEPIDYRKGIIPSFVITIGFILILTLTPVCYSDTGWQIGLLYDTSWFLRSAIFAVGSLLLTTVLWLCRKKIFFRNALVLMTTILCALYGFFYIKFGYDESYDHQEIIEDAVGLYGKMELPHEDDNFVRADFYECFDNMGLYWNIPSIHCFHSIVPTSVMEFYPEVNVTRDVSSKPDISYYALRTLLSVRYLYSDARETTPEMELCRGFTYYGTENNYNIYINENYVPMGFTFDHYISESEWESVPIEQRDKVLLSALVLTNSQILRYNSCLSPLPDGPDQYMPYEDFRRYATERRNDSSFYFHTTENGFESKIYLPKSNLVFFSVPYEEGWTAYVNGKETAIEKVDVGFMAVYAESGVNEIFFTYETPGLKIGLFLSLGALLLTALYIFLFYHLNKKHTEDLLMDEFYETHYDEEPEPELPPEDDLTVVRKSDDTPPYHDYHGPEEKIYPEL